MQTTGKYSIKLYQCSRCGNKERYYTNHWGAIYTTCNECSWKNPLQPTSVWKCLELVPLGYTKPEPWAFVRLSDIVR